MKKERILPRHFRAGMSSSLLAVVILAGVATLGAGLEIIPPSGRQLVSPRVRRRMLLQPAACNGQCNGIPAPNTGPPVGPGPNDQPAEVTGVNAGFGINPGQSRWDPIPSMSSTFIKHVGQYSGGKQVLGTPFSKDKKQYSGANR